MNQQTISKEYANDLIFEMEKAFWDERGKGARFRLTTVGREFFKTKCLSRLHSVEIDDIVRTIETVLRENGIAVRMSAEIDGKLLRVRIEGCAHRPVEDRMVAHEPKPFAPPPGGQSPI